MAKKQPSFEEAVEQLESIIERIESGEVGLEEAIREYEQGAALIKRCRAILNTAEKKIAELKIDDDLPGDDSAQGDETDSAAAFADTDEDPFQP